jgi:hypothetical protein
MQFSQITAACNYSAEVNDKLSDVDADDLHPGDR